MTHTRCATRRCFRTLPAASADSDGDVDHLERGGRPDPLPRRAPGAHADVGEATRTSQHRPPAQDDAAGEA